MTPIECPREQDVLDALASRRWPAGADGELRTHVAACGVCADLVTVAGALLDASDAMQVAQEVPPASLVWWRAQLRAREEAARAALRPIRFAQLAAAVCGAMLVVGAIAALGAPELPVFFRAAPAAVIRAAEAIPSLATEAASNFALATLANRGIQLALGAWLVLAPVAAYLAFSRD
jgi:hypothetical protein